MAKLAVFWIIFLIVPIANAVCTTPAENFEVKESAVLCHGIYNIESGMRVLADDVSIDCSNSMLIGSGIGYGILVQGDKVVVQNCNISNYEIGVYLDNTNSNTVANNYISNNKFGIALFNSLNNSIKDNILTRNAAGNSISYLPASLIEPEKDEVIETERSAPQDVMKEVIRVKKPDLKQDEVENEVDIILDKYFNTTKENLEITRAIFYNESDGSTSIILILRPKKILLNLSIYEKIPKCVSAYVNQILFETAGYEVIQNDPLVLWYFPKLDNEKKIAYKVLKNIDEECKSLLFAFGVASGFQEFEEAETKKGKNRNYLFASITAALMAIAAFYLIKKKSS